MKITRTISTLILISLILTLLISCGNDAGTPHPEDCTCEECIAAKGDTPPADGENGDTGIAHTFLYSDYSALVGFSMPTYIVDADDMEWLIDYVTNHEDLGNEAREELLGYIAGLPDDILDRSFLHIELFHPELIEEDSFRVVMEDGGLKALYVIKEKYSKLQFTERYQVLASSGLLIVEADKEFYHDDITFDYSYENVKVRDTASITLEGNTKNSALAGKDVEHTLLCSTHVIQNPVDGNDYYKIAGESYHADISKVDSWGFSPVIGSLEELGAMLSALGIESTAQEELEALGLTDQIFDDKVLIPFATRYVHSWESYTFLDNVCRVNGDGILEIELEADEDYGGYPTYASEPYTVLIGYVVIDRSVIEGVIGINEALIAFYFRFM